MCEHVFVCVCECARVSVCCFLGIWPRHTYLCVNESDSVRVCVCVHVYSRVSMGACLCVFTYSWANFLSQRTWGTLWSVGWLSTFWNQLPPSPPELLLLCAEAATGGFCLTKRCGEQIPLGNGLLILAWLVGYLWEGNCNGAVWGPTIAVWKCTPIVPLILLILFSYKSLIEMLCF